MTDIYLNFFAFLLSGVIVLYAVPSLIKLAYQKRLFDDPALEERKIHRYRTPNLGGVAVLTAFAFSACFFISGSILPYANFIFASGIIIFLVGLKDDLAALNPYKKFLAQFFTAFIVVYFADVRLSSFYGVLGIQEIHDVVSYSFSSLLIVFIINAFNLIDGINGLLGSVSLLISLTFGIVFYRMGESGLSVMAFSLSGAVLGFLKYNMGRARIFMGDAGAYTIGFILSVLSIQLIELNGNATAIVPPVVQSAPAVVIAALIIPIFDTLRVIVIRLSKGRSPFLADRNHLHHRLLDTGMSHFQATMTLAGFNLAMIVMAFTLQEIGTVNLLILITMVVLLLNTMFWLYDIGDNVSAEHSVLLDNTKSKVFPLKARSRKVAEEALQQLEEKQRQN